MTAAIILAAGRGSRLDRYTRHLPKALVRAGGHSLLDWHLDALRACAIEPVVVAGGYHHDRLARPGVELVEVSHWNETGPLASLIAARPARFEQGFIVVYADCPHHASNLRRLLDVHADIAVAGDRDWLALWSERHAQPLLDAETYRCADGMLLSIGARAQELLEVDAQFAGLLKFSRHGWLQALQVIEARTPAPVDMTGLLAALLDADMRISDVPIHGRWCEIDSAQDLRLCRRRLHADTPWSHDWRNAGASTGCR